MIIKTICEYFFRPDIIGWNRTARARAALAKQQQLTP